MFPHVLRPYGYFPKQKQNKTPKQPNNKSKKEKQTNKQKEKKKTSNMPTDR